MLLWHPIPLPLELTHAVHILDVCGVLPTSWPQGLQKSLQGTVRNRSLIDRSELKHKKKCGGGGGTGTYTTHEQKHMHTHTVPSVRAVSVARPHQTGLRRGSAVPADWAAPQPQSLGRCRSTVSWGAILDDMSLSWLLWLSPLMPEQDSRPSEHETGQGQRQVQH